MWNEVLKKIDPINTPKQAVERWSGDVNSIIIVSEGINLVYRFQRRYENCYLRMTHASLRSEEELLAAISYQRHLFDNNAPVCEPLLSKNYLWSESIIQGKEVFLAHVCREVPGVPITFNYKNNELYKTWGVALGKLHKAAQSYQPQHHSYTSWQQSLDELTCSAQNESEELQATLEEVIEYYKVRTSSFNNYGLTHGDHREGNVLTDGKKIHIIDFDLPSLNWFMEDIARPFFHSIIWEDKNWCSKLVPYLDGYLSIMSENGIDLAAFSKQIQLKGLEIYLWTKNNWSSETAPGGGQTKKWLEAIYTKIIDNTWTKSLPIISR
jgi:Ser/Thr protein kinase RdoA (MazF antagonist)